MERVTWVGRVTNQALVPKRVMNDRLMSGKSGCGERVMNQARTRWILPPYILHAPPPSLLKPLLPPPNAARPGRPPHEELQINYKAVDRAVEEDARLTIGARQAAHQVCGGGGEGRR